MTAEFYDDDYQDEHLAERQEESNDLQRELDRERRADKAYREWEPSDEGKAWLEAQAKRRLLARIYGPEE
jgi:hypothetical protein